MGTLLEDLHHHVRGEIRSDDISRSVYSVDASIYEIQPLAAVLPVDKQDLIAAVNIAAKHGVPIIPRGAATGIAGGCIGKGLVIDVSRHLQGIVDINEQNKTATCEPGVVQNALNRAVEHFGYRLGPETSTGNRATLGGMLANNSAGARSLHYGKMVDHVLEVELLLASGELLRFGAVDDDTLRHKLTLTTIEGDIYREVVRIRDHYRTEIALRFPHIPRRASGYNLDELLKKEPLNIAKLIAGSEGSLGIATEIKVSLSPLLHHTALVLIQFSSQKTAFEAVAGLLVGKPTAIEMIDHKIIQAAQMSPAMTKEIDWISGTPQALLIVEFAGETAVEAKEKAERCAAMARNGEIGTKVTVASDATSMAHVWKVREAGLGLLLSKRSYSRAIAFLEDVTVGPEHLAPFMQEFIQLLHDHGKEAGIYGHVGAGCMHVRPYVDLRSSDEIKLMRHLMDETSDLLLRYGGALSGEHGDGLVRSWLNEKMFGPTIYGAFVSLKKAFDPHGLMNPGKVVATQGLTENLRLDPNIHPMHVETFLDFSKEGGLTLAADLCNGNGLCRKREGLMCPSFQAFGDEYHSTRARAQGFRAVLNGRLPKEAFTSHELFDVLDYCLECKGCKTECPSQVDMAKMKAEFLHHYQAEHGVSVRSRLFGHLGDLYRWASPLAWLSNELATTAPSRWLLRKLGITTERQLPPLAREKFSQWLAKNPRSQKSNKRVVLFNDTYTEFLQPEIGIAAVRVLEALGYGVIVPEWRCCGRTLMSKGLLQDARQRAEGVLKTLVPLAQEGLSIIVLEPSCQSMVKDDYTSLVGQGLIGRVVAQTTTFDEFLAKHDLNGMQWRNDACKAYLHTHCHTKALIGSKPTAEVLRALPGVTMKEIDSGCCGLAGSFGYEEEHYEFSMKIGERILFPAVRRAENDAYIITSGLSCRSQITHGTTRSPIHLAQFVATRLMD